MNTSLKSVEELALNLEVQDRVRLAEVLLASITVPPRDVGSWALEIEERVLAHERGEVPLYAAEDVFAEVGSIGKGLGIVDILRRLPLREQIRLVEDLWDSIAVQNEVVPLTDEQKLEIDRRLQARQLGAAGSRLEVECAKLDPVIERSMAEQGGTRLGDKLLKSAREMRDGNAARITVVRGFEFASTSRVDRVHPLLDQFMSEIFDLEARDYLITDESTLRDFTGFDSPDTTSAWAKIKAAFDITPAEAGSETLVDIIEAIVAKRGPQ